MSHQAKLKNIRNAVDYGASSNWRGGLFTLKKNTDKLVTPQGKKLPLSFRAIFITTLAAGLVVLGLSAALIAMSWATNSSAKSDLASAEVALSAAQIKQVTAQSSYDSASRSYDAWRACYLSTSYALDWICGSEFQRLLAREAASATLKKASAEVSDARSALNGASNKAEAASSALEVNLWLWGTLSVVSLGGITTVGVMAYKKKRREQQIEATESRPDWDCPECSVHNDGGMFCVGCGFSKADIKVKAEVTDGDSSKVKAEE